MSDIRTSALGGIPFGNNAGRPAGATGQPYFNGEEARLELYTQGSGWQNIVQETPSIVSIIGALNENASSSVTISGSNFAAGSVAYVVGTNGVETVASSTTLVSVVQITAVFPALSASHEPYDIKVVNPSNLYGILYDGLTVDNSPVWVTPLGSLGSYTELSPISITVSATDAADATSSSLTYSVTSGSLPTGLSLNPSTGVISGTPSGIITNTTYSFTLGAYDGRNPVSLRNFSITINDRGPSWSTSQTLSTFTKNVAYSTTLVATDDSGIDSYSLVSGSLPTGLSLNPSTGVISGTPTSSTNSIFTIRATDDGGSYADRQFTIPNASPTWVTPSGLLGVYTKNVAFSSSVSGTDDGTISYAVVSGALPTDITLNTLTGVISGTSSSSSNSSFEIRIQDNAGNFIDRSFTINNSSPIWSTSSGSITSTTAGNSYSFQLSAPDDSGIAPTYTLTLGSLPQGLTLSSSGLISGTATVAGAFNFTVRATDENSNSVDRSFSIESIAPSGSQVFSSTSGTNFTVPVAVTSISVLGIGGGGGGSACNGNNYGGGGGGSGYLDVQTISVTPGETLVVTAGSSSAPTSYANDASSNGDGPNGSSSIVSRSGTTIFSANGGNGGRKGATSGEQSGYSRGGNGGNGGGAGDGYGGQGFGGSGGTNGSNGGDGTGNSAGSSSVGGSGSGDARITGAGGTGGQSYGAGGGGGGGFVGISGWTLPSLPSQISLSSGESTSYSGVGYGAGGPARGHTAGLGGSGLNGMVYIKW